MNSEFDELFDHLASAASPWDPMHAAAAYHAAKEQMTTEKSNSEIIMAGVASCLLATRALGDDDSEPLTRALAIRVLGHWGLSYTDPVAKTTTDASAVEPVLHWPPKPPAQLPEVYTTHYYHVRQDVAAPRANDGMVLLHDTVDVKPDHKLLFTGVVNWDSGRGCWAMRMTWTQGALGGDTKTAFWIYSRELRVGDEIPKVTP